MRGILIITLVAAHYNKSIQKLLIPLLGVQLLAFGFFAIYSVSIYESFAVTLRNFDQPFNDFYFNKQITSLIISLIIGTVVYFIPIRFFQKNDVVISLFVLIFIFQLLVFVPWLGNTLWWARGRIDIPWLPSMQPAEFFKLWYVFFLANRFLRKKKMINSIQFFSSFIIINGLLLVVFFLIPDLGTAFVLGLISMVMCRYAWARFKYIAAMVWLGFAWAIVFLSFLTAITSKFDYIVERMTYFVSSDIDPQSRQIGRQNQQALIAIGGWWFWWKGYGKWLQKFGYIPEAQSDFIFAAFSEEVWFIGNLLLLTLYFLIAFHFLTKLHLIKSQFLKLVGIGIISLIIIQMFVNMGVNLKFLPNTWLTLPFISAWWSALMINIVEIVLLYKILYRPRESK